MCCDNVTINKKHEVYIYIYIYIYIIYIYILYIYISYISNWTIAIGYIHIQVKPAGKDYVNVKTV